MFKNSTDQPSRPILRYHGGKWLLAEWIISQLPEHRVYVEPFGGAASVLLQKPRSEYAGLVLNVHPSGVQLVEATNESEGK